MNAATHMPDLDPQATATLLTAFLSVHAESPVDQLTAAIRAHCQSGWGHWQDPAPGGTEGRPATHLFEIAFLGLTATGTTPEEAARNWRRCALNQTDATA
jgi:hypothetical protein